LGWGGPTAGASAEYLGGRPPMSFLESQKCEQGAPAIRKKKSILAEAIFLGILDGTQMTPPWGDETARGGAGALSSDPRNG